MALHYEKQGRIAVFTLDRPDAMNALDLELSLEFSRALSDFRDDSSVWAGIVTGNGPKAFCAGGDIKGLLPWLKSNTGAPWRVPKTIMRGGFEIWKPMIAAVNGLALGGGCEIALACDIRLAADNALFGLPEVKLGLIAGWGGATRLPHTAPWANAAEMLFTGKTVTAQEAWRMGLVNKVVPQAGLMGAAKECAELICENAPLAVRAAKRVMLASRQANMDTGLKLEAEVEDDLLASSDFKEGVSAFTEKRKPHFKGE